MSELDSEPARESPKDRFRQLCEVMISTQSILRSSPDEGIIQLDAECPCTCGQRGLFFSQSQEGEPPLTIMRSYCPSCGKLGELVTSDISLDIAVPA